MLLHTATEEMGHVEMLVTAVALNLEHPPLSLQQLRDQSHALFATEASGKRPEPGRWISAGSIDGKDESSARRRRFCCASSDK